MCVWVGMCVEYECLCILCLFGCLRHAWGMLVYKELTSSVSMVSSSYGMYGFNVLDEVLGISYVGGNCLTAGCRYVSMNLDMHSVAELQLLTMGLPVIRLLWVFFRKYMCGIIMSRGGIRNAQCLFVICFVWCISWSALFMGCGRVCVQLCICCCVFEMVEHHLYI